MAALASLPYSATSINKHKHIKYKVDIIITIIIRYYSGALHGTAISLFQHGRDRVEDSTMSALNYTESSELSLKPLPHLYVTVPPVSLWKADPSVPETTCDMSMTDTVVMDAAMNREDMYVHKLHCVLFYCFNK